MRWSDLRPGDMIVSDRDHCELVLSVKFVLLDKVVITWLCTNGKNHIYNEMFYCNHSQINLSRYHVVRQGTRATTHV